MGIFIVLEGPDKIGKSEQARRLTDRLQSLGFDVLHREFPCQENVFGRTARKLLGIQGKDVREHMRSHGDYEPEVLLEALFQADKRAEAVFIERWLTASSTVAVVSRWTPSIRIYGYVSGLPEDLLENLCQGFPKPDLNVLLSIPESVYRQRHACLKSGDYGKLDSNDGDLQKQLRLLDLYAVYWKAKLSTDDPHDDRWAAVNGVGSAEEVFERLWRAVEPKLERKGKGA